MQYFSDLLDRQVTLGRLTPHQHCSNPLITHLTFADDLFIFFKANTQSAQSIMQVLNEFAGISGLHPNPAKSVIFLAGCNTTTERQIIDKLGMQKGELPVKYLGIPLISKRLTFQDCTPLLEAIGLKIQSWQNTSLSYAGRAELIRTVLMGRILYWISSFLLPQKVISRLTQLLTRFLWSGQDKRGMHKVAWQEVCQPKQEGGLGMRCITTLNKACMMRLIWAAVSNKESLWVKWINERYLTGNSIWTLHTPYSCSWAFRSLLQVRNLAISCIKYFIGNGSDTLLWLDPWHPRGVLHLVFGEHISYEVNPNRMAKVSTIRHGDTWRVTHPHSTCLISVWDALNSITTLHDSTDEIAWTPSQSGAYTLKSAYEHIRPTGTVQDWHRHIWFKGAIPKYSFITWLLYKGKLTTLDRLHQWGLLQDDKCHLCHQEPETIQHLFFECIYTSATWSSILQKCSINRTPTGWRDERTWLNAALAGDRPTHTAKKLAFTATVHHIWTERNSRIFRGINKPVQSVISSITAAIKCRLTFLFPQAQDMADNRAMLGSWGIPTKFRATTHTWVKWNIPQPGHITLNTDASLCQGRAGLGYILRNDQGDPILAGTSAVIPSHSILIHEMQAILRGLTTAISQQYTYIQVQSDSKVAIDNINGTAAAPWTCWTILSNIKYIRNRHNVCFSYVPRQANQPADYLSHVCQHITEEDTIMLPGEIPQELQALIARDKQQQVYLRL